MINENRFTIDDNDNNRDELLLTNERLIDDISRNNKNYFKYFKAFILFTSSFGITIFIIISLYNSVTKISPQYSSFFLTSIATFALYLAKTVIMAIWNYFIIRNFFTRVIINKDLPNSSIMIPWILSKVINNNNINDKKCKIYNLGKNNIILNYFPNKGWYTYNHTFNGSNYKLYINYRLGDIIGSYEQNNLFRTDEIIIYVMNLDTNIITNFIQECYKSYYQKSDSICLWNYDKEWIEEKRLNNLSVRDYTFKDNLLENTKKIIDIYLGCKNLNWRSTNMSINNLTDSMIDHYNSKGFILLGPSGTGKTKFIEKIAYELNMNIGLFDITSPNLTTTDLINAFNNIPINTILVLEHIDYVEGNIKLSCLYNCLSGLKQKKNLIIFATANNIKDIDKNIIEPNRMGHIIKFNYTDNIDRSKIFKYWYEYMENNIIDDINNIIQQIETEQKINFSHAFIQNMCKECKCLDINIYSLKDYIKNYIESQI